MATKIESRILNALLDSYEKAGHLSEKTKISRRSKFLLPSFFQDTMMIPTSPFIKKSTQILSR